jgi:hypothetical protein
VIDVHPLDSKNGAGTSKLRYFYAFVSLCLLIGK